jgi:hypothetical protein
MPLPLIMAVGAGIGALAGVAVYGAKVIFSKKTDWNWRDAGAHAVGGAVGGGLFPVVMAGLGAVGVPAAAAYVVSGGLAWGGIWTLAQDATSWALGRRDGMASPKKYLISTAIGMAVSAMLLPLASRAIGPGMSFRPHSGTTSAYLSAPRTAADVLKAEGEFLAYGALNETADAGLTAVARLATAGARNATSAGARNATTLSTRSATALTTRSANELLPANDELLPSHEERSALPAVAPFDRGLGLDPTGPLTSLSAVTSAQSPFGLLYSGRASDFDHPRLSPGPVWAPANPPENSREGLSQVLEGKTR